MKSGQLLESNEPRTEPKPHPEADVARHLGLDSSSVLGRRLTLWLIWGALVLVVVSVGLVWITMGTADKVQYKTQAAERGNLTVTVTATGTLEPTNQVDVGIEVSGTIKTVEVDYNDRVKVGQVLARLDTSKLEAQVLQSTAALESARAKVLQTRATAQEAAIQLARLTQVWESTGGESPAQHDLDVARAALERARADEASANAVVSQAQATLDANRTDLAKAVIRSPINGVVLRRSVEPGQTVAATLQAPVLFTLAEDLTQMELQVDVDEADVGQVRQGQQATFTVDAYPDRTFPARITLVRYGSETVAGVVTYKAVLKVDNSSLSLRPGMTATAAITVKQVENAVLVPNAALRFTPPAQEPAAPTGDGGILSKILPRPPSPVSFREEAKTAARRERVWTLRDGQLAAISIATGATDGIMTEVTGGEVEPGLALVVDIVSARR
jgi:HlyD family secretion protein